LQFHAGLGEERDSGVQVADDDGNVVHPLDSHAAQHRIAASCQAGAEETRGPGDPDGTDPQYDAQ
jgi:hypothetical protein